MILNGQHQEALKGDKIKTTEELYGCSPLLWAKMGYEEAMHFRKRMAKRKMFRYRLRAGIIRDKINSKKYKRLVELFRNSEEAANWNQYFIDEIEIERERKRNESKNQRNKDWMFFSKWYESCCKEFQGSNEHILTGTWKWLKSHIP